MKSISLSLVLALNLGAIAACDVPTEPSGHARATPTPTFTPKPTVLPSPTPSPQPILVQFLGGVTDEGGAPIVGAYMGIEYRDTAGRSQWRSFRTIEGGRYSAHLPAKAGSFYGLPNGLAIVTASGDYFDYNVQVVTGDALENDVSFRLRPYRNLAAGNSMNVTVDNFSSLCVDWDTVMNFQARCENIYMEIKSAGTLTVEALPVSPGGFVPLVELVYYGPAKSGKVSAPVRSGDWMWIRVQVPNDAAGQQYLVTTAMSAAVK